MREFLAHIRQDNNGRTEQTVRQHSCKTAQYAADRLKDIGLEHFGFLAGILHDMGKAKDEFTEYLEKAVQDRDSVRRGSVNHTFAGCRYLLEQFHKAKDETGLEQLTSELLAYAVGAHHGQFDCVDSHHQNGFEYRLEKENIGYEESVRNFLAEVIEEAEIEHLFVQAQEELYAVCVKINGLIEGSKDEEHDGFFYYGLLARLILSALMDADRTDTAEFMNDRPYPKQLQGEERAAMWQNCLKYMERELDKFPQDKPIQIARRRISDQCAAFAHKSAGIYRLNVPTGGGKTLSALRYALTHARQWNKSRIILTSSLLSILDQNATVIRSYLPDDVQILEHHSNVVQPKEEDEKIEWEMLTEQYSAPIVITTLVQLLNTLFAGKSASIRRFQALTDSIIVIDEVQTVPSHLLTLFNLAVNFLAAICNTTVVLCSATQPALELAAHPLLGGMEEMVPYEESLWRPFRRTEICDAGSLRLDEIPEFVREKAKDSQSLLLVCNTKSEAAYLFEALADGTEECFHLSAGMCMEHRRDILKRIQDALADGRQIICVSTQVIEAGVDISFGCVIRLAAGMDSIVQAAGRCNRNGEVSGTVPVYVIRCTDEKLTRLVDIQRGKEASEALLNAFSKKPEQFMGDLTSDAAIRRYYRTLYAGLKEKYQDDYIPEVGCSVFELLSINGNNLQGAPSAGKYILNQAFKTAGDVFTVFAQDTMDVLVPYGRGREISNRFFDMDRQYAVDYEALETLLQEAKAYTVSLYRYQSEELEKCGALAQLCQGRIHVLLDGFYDDTIGFSMKQSMGGVI